MKRSVFRFLPLILMVGALGAAAIFVWMDVQKSTPKEVRESATTETYPSALCTNGTTVVMRANIGNTTLRAGERYAVVAGDTVKTLTEWSAATIFWSEGSVTRLGGKTSLEIKETGTAESKRVDFSLENGKTYSRIFEYLRDDEYFRERYDSGRRIASVRGTAFEVNADNGYVRSLHHAIEVSEIGKNISTLLSEWKAVALTDAAKEVSTRVLDSAWEKINSTEDREMLAKYLQGVATKFKSISTAFTSGSGQIVSLTASGIELNFDPSRIASGALSPEQMSTVQNFYYKVGGLDVPQEAKNSLREFILSNASGSLRPMLESDFARHSLYDLADAEKAGNEQVVKQLENIMKTYNLDSAAKDTINQLKKSMNLENLEGMKDTIEQQAKQAADALFNSLSQ